MVGRAGSARRTQRCHTGLVEGSLPRHTASAMKIYSYVVQHDRGYAPFADEKYCTLVNCKYAKKDKPKNIVECAEEKDWIIGTGGANRRKSTGIGTLVFAMQVTKKLALVDYKKKFRTRIDADQTERQKKRFALISNRFVYYGAEAKHNGLRLKRAWRKKGPKYRVIDDPKDVAEVLKLLKPRLHGKCGKPTWPHPLHPLYTRTKRRIPKQGCR